MTAGPRFEVAPREDTRSPVRGRPPRPWRPMLYLLPASALVGVVLVLPLVSTVLVSLHDGLDGYRRALEDAQVRHAIGNSLVWLVLAPVVCLFGLGLAWLARGAPALGLLAAPVAVSALVTGIAFRLLFRPDGTANAVLGHGTMFLGSTGIWLVLGLAFAWQWAGLAVVAFRAGLAGIPDALVRMARAFGAGSLRRLVTVTAPALFPVGALVLLITLVSAARTFELVLISAPGSVQSEVDVVGLHWWRAGSDLGDSGRAALAVMLFAVVALAALGGLWGLSREWPSGSEGSPESLSESPLESASESASENPTGGPSGRTSGVPGWARRTGPVLTVAALAVWVLPLLVLLLTSLHTPAAAASGEWWQGGLGLGSYRDAFDSGELTYALVNTGARALVAALLVLVLAVPAAYALAWGGMSRRTNQALIAVTAILAVVPPQTVIVTLGQVFDRVHLLGAPTALTVVHTAFGVPLAVLLLRAAFASVPASVVRIPQLDPEPGSAMSAAVRESVPAVVTVAVLEFVLVWNDFVVGLLLGGPETGQVTLVLFDQARKFGATAGALSAGAVVATAIPLGLVLTTGTWLVRGLTRGVRR